MIKAHHRWMCFADHRPAMNISLRLFMAVFGGYGLALLCGAALASGLSFALAFDAVTFAVMIAFIVQLVAVIWVIAAATLVRAALGLIIPAAIFGAWLVAPQLVS
ncbi:MAG: iron transporter [Burkholderiales bacterium]|nr:iron transporter [Burkholderiales bacterium]